MCNELWAGIVICTELEVGNMVWLLFIGFMWAMFNVLLGRQLLKSDSRLISSAGAAGFNLALLLVTFML